MEKSRVIIINNQIMPYRVPLFNKIAQVTSLNITVLYCSTRSQDREWTLNTQRLQFDYHILKSWSFKIPKSSYREEWRFIRLNPTLFFTLKNLNPSLIIAYEYSVPTLIALIYAKLFRRKLMIWTEMTAHTDRSLSKGQELMRRLIIPNAHGFIGTSHAACDNFRRRGVEAHKIFLAPQTFDTDQFDSLPPTSDHPPTVIYAGYLSERKGVQHLVQAFVHVIEVLPTAQLILIGNGHAREQLEKIVDDCKLGDNVIFTGFVEPDVIPQHYARGDVFVLPSLEDTFGVVATEAIAAGLTLICSQFAGYSSHMTHEEDGLIIDPTNHNQLANAMIELLSNSTMRDVMNQEAQKRLQQFVPENVSKNFVTAIEQTLNPSV